MSKKERTIEITTIATYKDKTIRVDKLLQYLFDENQELKKDIKNIIRILNKNCDDLEATEEEFESLEKWNK